MFYHLNLTPVPGSVHEPTVHPVPDELCFIDEDRSPFNLYLFWILEPIQLAQQIEERAVIDPCAKSGIDCPSKVPWVLVQRYVFCSAPAHD